ncbi:hypothetical protein [Haloechinothrix halophila]|uniref:hypothetical protein n=1 Tax=Haloechinothrix halophila TaxID=1069073 RepID=UPI0012F900A3|nr:hypothetical protein [Haloechinothrix halophila]
MPAESNDLESRVTALEEQMRVVTADAAAARVLAGGADRDVSAMQDQLRAHTKLLNALRETQVEHGDKLDGINGRLDNLEGRFDGLDGRIDGLEGRFDGLDGRFDNLEGRFDGLGGRIDGIDGRLDNLEGRFDGLDGRIDGLEGRFDGLDGRIDGVAGGFAKVGADIAQMMAVLTGLTEKARNDD